MMLDRSGLLMNKICIHFLDLLRPRIYILTNYQVLIHFKTQRNLSKIHALCVAYSGVFNYVIKYKASSSNIVVDALSRRAALLVTNN